MKKPWLSKTLWINALVAVGALAYPPASDFIQAHTSEVMLGFSIVNILLRALTKDALGLED